MREQRIDYCAHCGRLDRLDPFGICATCVALPNVIELEVEHITLRSTPYQRAVALLHEFKP